MSRKRHTDAQSCLNALLTSYEASPTRAQRYYEHISDHFPDMTREQSFLETMRAAEQIQAIRLHMGKGDTAHLMAKVELLNPDPLYVFLSRLPRGDQSERAELIIRTKLSGFEIAPQAEDLLASIVDAWRHGKTYHRLSVDDTDAAANFVKSFSAVVTKPATDDRDLRTYSRQTCGDSKMIEGHKSRIISEAQRQGIIPVEVERDNIDALLGLEKFPHLVQVAGALPILQHLSQPRRHTGLHPDEIKNLEVRDFASLTTIENYASFNRHVREAMGPSEVVIYTGGWPGRAECALISRLAPYAASIYHWGDIDPAGLGIADAVWRAAGKPVSLHLMTQQIAQGYGSENTSVSKLSVSPTSPAFKMLEWLSTPQGRILEQEELDPCPV